MINSEKAKSQYVTAGVNGFEIGFEYGLDDLGNPEIAVTLDGIPLQFGTGYTLSLDKKNIFLVDGAGHGKTLIIERDIDFVQDSDYQLGRIDPEQIEDDFDLSVMRDQQIRQGLEDYKTVTDSALEDISEQLVEHQESIDTLTQNVADLETNKADKSSVYTKGETDDKLALKADKADTYTKSDVDTRLATKADVSAVYTKADVDGKLAVKADKATTLAGYGITDAYTKEETDAKVSSVYRFKGSVATYSSLPTSGQAVGDVWNVEDTGANYAWTGDAWDKLSETIDLTPYLTKDDATATYATIASVEEVSEGLDAKLDKSGGVVTGALTFVDSDGNTSAIRPTSNMMSISIDRVPAWYFTNKSIIPAASIVRPNIGTSSSSKIYTIYTERIANGSNVIEVPTTGGTMALAENTVAKEQGVDNAGKVLGIGEDGNVTPVEVAVGDYVEKAGDEMTGPLGFVNSDSAKAAIDIDDTGFFTLSFGDNAQPSYRVNSDLFIPTTDGGQALGSHDYRWESIYTKYIYGEGGSPITVPAKNGEMLVAIGGTEGQVLTKTADGCEWLDAQGGGASTDPFPTEDDFIPIIYSATSEEPETFFDGAIQINLGALSDGEYEFYVKTKPSDDSNFMRHYFRVTIKDGQIDWQYPSTYYTIAFDPTETGSLQMQNGYNWASDDLRGLPIYGGKINNDYIIECKPGYNPVAPGSFYWNEITNGDEIGYVSKVRNIVTQETVTPIITLKHNGDVVDPNLSERQIGTNPFYLRQEQTTTKRANTIYPSNTTKVISLGVQQALRPGSDVSGYQYALYPAEILVSIYSFDTTSELDFVFKSDRAGFSIQEIKATGVFVGTKYAVYTTSDFGPDYIELALSKDSAFGFNSEEYIISVTETGVGRMRSVQRTRFWDSLPSEFSLLQEITPASETTTGLISAARIANLPAENGTYTLELTITDGVATMAWVLKQ